MKKMIRKIKKLFIEELETRKSTSPLFIQTLAGGEAGVSGKEPPTGASKAGLMKRQEAKEGLIAQKNDIVLVKYAPPRPTAANTEGGITPKPIPLIGPVVKYAPPTPTDSISEGGITPKPLPIIGPVPLYAPPKPTESNTEGGITPKPLPIIGPVIIKYAPPEQTTLAMGEEGIAPKPTDTISEGGLVVKYAPPQTTLAMGEEGIAPKPDDGDPMPLYAPPDVNTTLAIGEEGIAPKPTDTISEGGVIVKYAPPGPTTLAIGEEGIAPK